MAKKQYNKFVSETLKICQVPMSTLPKGFVEFARKNATYVDTDKTLNEFMVSVDFLEEHLKSGKKRHADIIKKLMPEITTFQYVHLTQI